MPYPVLSLASAVASPIANTLRIKNQLYGKAVTQMTAPAFCCSGDALVRDLGWRARVSLDDAVQRTADGYKEDGWL